MAKKYFLIIFYIAFALKSCMYNIKVRFFLSSPSACGQAELLETKIGVVKMEVIDRIRVLGGQKKILYKCHLCLIEYL